MKCANCKREMREGLEQVGIGINNQPIVHKFGYCDYCKIKTDIDLVNSYQEPKKKDSVLSIIAAVLALFTCLAYLGGLLGIIDLCMNDKTKKHGGSWFALIWCIIITIVGFVLFYDNSNIEDISNNTNTQISVGDTFNYDGLNITVDDCDFEFTDYEDEYGLYKLDDGFKYIKVSFTYKNNNDSDEYVSIYDYECYSDGQLCEQTYYFNDDFVNANIGKNRNVSFSTYYIVPIDAKSIELEYTQMWDNDKIIIKLK